MRLKKPGFGWKRRINLDGAVKSLISDGAVKVQDQGLRNFKECSVVSRTGNSEKLRVTQVLNFLRRHQPSN
ncbi:MAG: hypothetical protein K9K81_07025 [Desulfobacteraceae bacterium]|nr:hypothetical protein [Desulfobacteraceae bacterium]